MENVQLVLPGVRLVVGVRRVGGGDPLSSEYQPSGLAIAMVETLRHEVGRGGGRGVGGKRGIVDGAQLKRWSNCRGVVSSRARWGDSVRRSWTIAAGRQVSLRQERRLHTAVKPSADEVPLGWGRARGEACPDGLSCAAGGEWWGSALDWRGLVWCEPRHVGGHVEMLQALPWLGWRAARLSRGCHQPRETWWYRGRCAATIYARRRE